MDSAVPVMRAIENVKRDIRKVCCDSDEKGCDIVLIMENMQAEQFEIKCDNNMLVIYASDTLGFVYGLYHISRDILGVLPFWFWNDQVFIKKKGCRISGEYAYTSKPYAVKYRGWFVMMRCLYTSGMLTGKRICRGKWFLRHCLDAVESGYTRY